VEQMDMEPSCHLYKPMEVIETGSGFVLEPFPKWSDDEDVLIYSEMLATMVTPDKALLEKYQMMIK
jgi:hypothetical protein